MKALLKKSEPLNKFLSAHEAEDKEGVIILDEEFLYENFGEEWRDITSAEIRSLIKEAFSERSPRSISGWYESNGVLTSCNQTMSIPELHEVYGDDVSVLLENIERIK